MYIRADRDLGEDGVLVTHNDEDLINNTCSVWSLLKGNGIELEISAVCVHEGLTTRVHREDSKLLLRLSRK